MSTINPNSSRSSHSVNEDARDLLTGQYSKKENKILRNIFCESMRDASQEIKKKYKFEIKCEKESPFDRV